MAKTSITFEDTGTKSVSIVTEIEGAEMSGDAVSPAMALTLATRALFECGILAEAAGVALAAIAAQKVPTECLLAHFKKDEEDPPYGHGL